MATVKDILVQHIISDVELCYFETFSANTDTGKFNLVLLYKEHGKHQFIEGISEIKPEDMKEELRACNRNIKFGVFHDFCTQRLGCDLVRIISDENKICHFPYN